jgi:hypothetical protein
MNLVLEGPDYAGKTTLGQRLSYLTGMPLISGDGPPRSAGEFTGRVCRYLAMTGVIFDRHPLISDPIYGPIIRRHTYVTSEMVKQFRGTRPFIIYVQPETTELSPNHKCKEDHETEEHVAGVQAHHRAICKKYAEVMPSIAHYVYRRGDSHLENLLYTSAQFAPVGAQAVAQLFPSPIDIAAQQGRVDGRLYRWANKPLTHTDTRRRAG